MNSLPNYTFILFIVSACITFLLLLQAFQFHKRVFTFLLALFITQGMVAFDNFYLDTTARPPHLLFLLMPSILLMLSVFIVPSFRTLLSSIQLQFLVAIHLVRIPVEIVLWELAKNKLIPLDMTFEGSNFDIFSGLSAIAILYFGFKKKTLSKTVFLLWNIACLALLLNVVIRGVLSVPSPFQQLNLEQPNIAMLYFPFCWLPSFIVPAIFFAHLLSIRMLLQKKE